MSGLVQWTGLPGLRGANAQLKTLLFCLVHRRKRWFVFDFKPGQQATAQKSVGLIGLKSFYWSFISNWKKIGPLGGSTLVCPTLQKHGSFLFFSHFKPLLKISYLRKLPCFPKVMLKNKCVCAFDRLKKKFHEYWFGYSLKVAPEVHFNIPNIKHLTCSINQTHNNNKKSDTKQNVKVSNQIPHKQSRMI